MKKYINFFAGIAATALLASCSSESPFNTESEEGVGRILKSAIAVDVKTDENISRSGDADLNDFVISFLKEGETEAYATYSYASMPEVVSLPAGVYTAQAVMGDDREAAFNAPYYLGSSESFRIVPDKITDDIGDIVCSLYNVKVSVIFDPSLVEQMTDDSAVIVSLNGGKSLSFHKDDYEAGRAGYFRFTEGAQMSATFDGIVEGWETHETKVYDNVSNGTHYIITFKLHAHGTTQGGGADAGIRVDASLTSVDVNREVPAEEEQPLEDEDRPGQGQNQGGGNETPDNPDPAEGGPAITGVAPISLDKENVVTDGMTCVLEITSATGIKTFEVEIISPTLTTEELQGVGLDSHLDLVNPGALEPALTGLGFPVYVAGKTYVKFDITNFLPMLAALGDGTHKFQLTVSDDEGTTVKTLTLVCK